jgi:hypothetical protein
MITEWIIAPTLKKSCTCKWMCCECDAMALPYTVSLFISV